jgi:hypothetical protein
MPVIKKWSQAQGQFLTAAERAANPTWKISQRQAQKTKVNRERGGSEEIDPQLEAEPGERVTQMSLKKFLTVAFLSLVFVLGLGVFITIAIIHNRLGREVSRLTNERVRLTEINRELKADMARLTVYEDLEFVARNSLGLVTPSKGQIVIIE